MSRYHDAGLSFRMRVLIALCGGLAVITTLIGSRVVKMKDMTAAFSFRSEARLPTAIPVLPVLPDNPGMIDRVALAKDWIADAELIARQTQDAEALELVSYLKLQSIHAPTAEGVTNFDPNSKKLSLVMTLPGDERLSPTWKYFLADVREAAKYLVHQHAIILKQQFHYTHFARGIMVLHEARHAWQYEHGGVVDEDEQSKLLEEVATREFTYRLMKKLGGREYQKILINAEYITEASPYVFPFTGKYDTGLDKLFGQCASEYEQVWRMSELWADAYFSLVNDEPDAQEKKAVFIKRARGDIDSYQTAEAFVARG